MKVIKEVVIETQELEVEFTADDVLDILPTYLREQVEKQIQKYSASKAQSPAEFRAEQDAKAVHLKRYKDEKATDEELLAGRLA